MLSFLTFLSKVAHHGFSGDENLYVSPIWYYRGTSFFFIYFFSFSPCVISRHFII